MVSQVITSESNAHAARTVRRDASPTIAVIGCGAIAERYHLPALAKNRRVLERAILVDPDAARTSRLSTSFGIRHALPDVASLDGDIDGAIVAAPPALHYPICMDLLTRGIPVLCEKPLADSEARATEMVKCAADHSTVLCVNHTRRLYPAYQMIRRLLSEGAIGTVSEVKYDEGFEFDWPAATAHHFRSGARGALFDTGIHGLDVLCWWMGGRPTLVSSETDSFGGPEAMARVRMRRGACRAELKISWLTRLANQFSIVGDAGEIRGRIDIWNRVHIATRDGRQRQIRLRTCEKSYAEFGVRMIRNFLEVVAGRDAPLVPAADVLPALELMDAAYGAARRLPLPWLRPAEGACHE